MVEENKKPYIEANGVANVVMSMEESLRLKRPVTPEQLQQWVKDLRTFCDFTVEWNAGTAVRWHDFLKVKAPNKP